MMRDPEQTIGNLIDKQKHAFIGSIDDTGYPNLKVMNAPNKRNGIKEFWFTTNTDSLRVEQYRANPKACIYFYDGRFYRAVQLIGTMEVLTDDGIKEELWKEGYETYYQKGITDPDYCVLKFTAQKGRYYSNFKSVDFYV